LQGDAEVISLIIPKSTLIDNEADDIESVDIENPEEVSELDTDPSATTGDEQATDTVSGVASDEQIYILTASVNGYGKRTRLEEFPLRGRGGQGVIAMQTSARNGALVAAMQVATCDEMMLITDRGTLVRTRVEEVSTTSRNTQGVMLIRLGESESLVKTVRVDDPGGDPSGDASPGGDPSSDGDSSIEASADPESSDTNPQADAGEAPTDNDPETPDQN
ncbi:MAG TPA: DNA gyrase C-terminal beta-propeller domain-containing protein, partial [Modicisalibacter sp.]|nr:DNA gyrase C-terminal beta-propeller domain-containing protein [Modicisalibacter sp.]